MIVGVGAALAFFSALPAVDGAMAQPPSPAPPYLVGENHAVQVFSNGEWKVGSGAGRRAKQTAPTAKADDASADRAFNVWDRTCRRGRQTVRFRRDVWLPGPPRAHDHYEEDLDWGFAPYDAQARDIERYELRFNGVLVVRRTRANLFADLPAAAATKLLRGNNTIELTVVKRPGSCRSWDPRRLKWVAYRGVAFTLAAHFDTDLEVEQGGVQVAYSKTRNVRMSITVRNKGPSEAARARFELTMNPRPMELSSVGQVFARFSSDGAVTGCAEVKGDPAWVALRCEWANFAPGTEGHVIVELMLLPVKTPFFRFEQTLGWRIQIPQDDLSARVLRETDDRNNRRVDIKHVFCGDLDRAPECVNAA